MLNNNINDNHILYIQTKKISAIKSLIEALKEIFRDVNIKFTPKMEIPCENDDTKTKVISGGMYITALNSNSNILVRLHLEADKFCFYHCKPENKQYIMLGVNMTNLYKLIKFLNNDDELHIIYDKLSYNQLNLLYINKQKKLTSNYYLNLLDLKEDIYTIGKQQFDFVITVPSLDFHNLIKNMSVIAEQVDIKFIHNDDNYSLSFSCKGEFASQESVFNGNMNNTDKNNILNIKKTKDINDNTIIQGIYELKSLSLFSRCSSLCSTIELHIKNDSPLIIKYRVADMGSVYLILSPNNINNENFESESDNNSSDDNSD